MKDGPKHLIGKVISGAVVAKGRLGREQLFITFTDDTYFEIWGDSFNCNSGVDPGGAEAAIDYAIRGGAEVIAVYPK